MIGEDFSYDNQLLSSYNMIMCDPDNEREFVQRAIDRSDITSIRSIPNHFSVHYEDTKTLQFLIIKDPCEYSTQEEMELSGDEVNALRAWLESPKKPTELLVDDGDDTNTTVHYFGIFTSVQPYTMSEACYGLYLTFICNAPYGFSDEVTASANVGRASSAKTVTFSNDSADRQDYVRPVITIQSASTFNGTESITITNASDNGRNFEITLPSGASSLTIDCDKRVISDNTGRLVSLSELGITIPEESNYSFINTDVYLFYWLRLIPGDNTITVQASSGNTVSTVDITARYPIKSGGF